MYRPSLPRATSVDSALGCSARDARAPHPRSLSAHGAGGRETRRSDREGKSWGRESAPLASRRPVPNGASTRCLVRWQCIAAKVAVRANPVDARDPTLPGAHERKICGCGREYRFHHHRAHQSFRSCLCLSRWEEKASRELPHMGHSIPDTRQPQPPDFRSNWPDRSRTCPLNRRPLLSVSARPRPFRLPWHVLHSC